MVTTTNIITDIK